MFTEVLFWILWFKIYSEAKLQIIFAFSDLKFTSICPLIFDPKNSSSLIVPFKIFFSLSLWAILISSGLIVTVNKSSFILSLHANTYPLISMLLSEILLALNKFVVPIKFAEKAVFGLE